MANPTIRHIRAYTVGFAVTTAGVIGAYIIEQHLSRFIEGHGIDDIDLMWDQMYNASLFYGRKGIVLNAISGVDLALSDLLVKCRSEPVYQLLGGAVRREIEFYATGPRPDLAQQLGFIGGKMPLHHGPAVHFVVTCHNSPFAESLMMAPAADRVVSMFTPLLLDEPVPVNGRLQVPDLPRFGVRLNPQCALQRPYEH